MDRKVYKPILMILLGTFIEACSYYHINFQNSLSEGGFMGISLLVKYVLDISPAITMIILDIPIFILGLKFMGRKFLIYSLFAAVSFSAFYHLCERFSPFVLDLTDTMIIASILSGITTGYGLGLVFRYAAAGGEEILALLFNKRFGLEIGTFFVISDCIVLVLSLFYISFAQFMYTIIAVFIAGKVITWTYKSGQKMYIPV